MPKTPYLKSQTRQTDWCVVIPKVPESLADTVAEKLTQHFSLTPQEAQETITHTPIILLDELDHDAACKVKSVFDGTGVELILTQEPAYKKKCFRVLWPKESNEVLARWRSESSAPIEESQRRDEISSPEASSESLLSSERGQNDSGLKKRLSELEARLKIAEARDKELQGELSKREKMICSREEVLQQEKKVSQRLQSLFDQGQKESSDWMRKAERAQERIKALEAEKNDLNEKLQARTRAVGHEKGQGDQLAAEREDGSKQLERKNREFELRQRAFDQQIAELEKKYTRDKTGYVEEKIQWTKIHEQSQQEIRAAQQKSAELTDQIKALRRNITDREEASKLSTQTFKDVTRKNQALLNKMIQLEGQAGKFENIREDLKRQLNQVCIELEEKNKLYESTVSFYEKRSGALECESNAEREAFTEEKKTFNQTLENLRAEITALKSQKISVQDGLADAEKRCSQLTASLDVYAKDQQSSLTRMEQLKQTESRLNSDIQNLQNRLASTTEEKAAQEVSMRQLGVRVSELEQLSATLGVSLQDEAAKLSQERDAAERSAARIRQLEDEQLNLEKLLEAANVDYRDAVGRIAGLEKNLSDLIENQKGLEQSLGQKVQELDRLRESAVLVEAESGSRQVRIEGLEVLKSQIEAEREKLIAAKTALERQRDALFEQVSELTETRSQWSAQKKELEHQRDGLSSDVKTLRESLDTRTQDLEASLREREKQSVEWSAKYNDLKETTDAECESLRAEQSRLEGSLQAVREEKTNVLKNVSDLESRLVELDQKRIGLERELSEKTEQLGQWTLFAGQAEAKAELLQKTMGELESNKADFESERAALRSSKDHFESQSALFEKNLVEAARERERLLEIKQGLENTVELLESQLKVLREEFKQQTEELEAAKGGVERQREELLKAKTGYEEDLRGTAAELRRLTQLLEQAEANSDTKKKRVEELEIAQCEAEACCERLKVDVSQMSHENKTLVQQMVEIQASFNSLEMENSLASLESRRKFLEAELEVRATDVEKWMDAARLAENEAQKINEQQAALVETNELLKKKCTGLESELKSLLNGPKEIEQKAGEIARLEAELQAASAARDSAIDEAKLLAERNEEQSSVLAQDWEQRYAILKSTITKEREDFEQERAELLKKQDKLGKLDNELNQARERITELEANRHALQTKLDEAQSVIGDRALFAPDNDQKKIRDDLDSSHQEIQKLSLKYRALEEIKNEFVGLLGSERLRYEALQSQYDQLKEQFGAMVRKQTEVISFELDSAKIKVKDMGVDSNTEKLVRLKQILDFEDKRGGQKEIDS